MIRLLSIIFLVFPLPAFAQVYINKPYQQVKKEIQENEFKKFNRNPVINLADTAIIFSAGNPPCPPMRFIFRFDENKKCKSEEIQTGCQEFFMKSLTQIVETKKYNWTKINENQYVSDFDSGLMIEFPPDNTTFSFIILRMNWTHELYDLLMKN